MFLFAVAAALFAFLKNQEAQHQSKIALSRQLAAQADKLTDSRLDLALLLGVEAFQVEPTQEARDSLLTLIRKHPDITRLLQGHTKLVLDRGLQPGWQDSGFGE